MAHLCDIRAVAARSSGQFGLVTSAQLSELGMSRQGVRTLESRGALERLGGRVWRLAGHPPSHRQRLLAAVLGAGPGAAVSHMAACAWWRFAGITPGAVEVSVERPVQRCDIAGVVHRVRDLSPVDVDRREVVPVTTPSRSLIDAAPRMTSAQIADVLDAAARDGTIDLAHLRWRLDELRRRGRPGIRRVVAALPPEPRPREESWLERRLTRLIARAGLPRPRLQVPLRHSGGTARVDMYYPHARLVIETDGHGSHATRRERQADAERDARLGAAGYRVLRFTYEDVVRRPEYVLGMIRTYVVPTSASAKVSHAAGSPES
jgi:very-short-patch-repair endonuclease/predicted transcriptional regulator of viral defense system